MFCRAVERFLLLPDFQQGEQLCCKHRIAASIIDFFRFLLRSWQSDPWQPGKSQQWGRRSFVLETCIFWRCMFNWCGYYFSWKKAHYQINNLAAALVRSLMNSCNSSLAQIKRNTYHVDLGLQPSFIQLSPKYTFWGLFLCRPPTCLCTGFGLRRAGLGSAVGHRWLGLSFGCSFFKPKFFSGNYGPKYTWWRGELGLHLLMVVMLISCPLVSQGVGTVAPGPLWASWRDA